jgi:dTDP-4-dehydrorhamnose 3,5-epimerase
MEFTETTLPGVLVVESEIFTDDRGYFTAPWIGHALEARGLAATMAQCGITHNTTRGTIRGMHFQAAPFEQAKLVRTTNGRVFDVAVDLRRDSPSFRRWVGVELSGENHKMLYIPAGFAHGYQTLTDSATVLYFMSHPYSAAHGRGIRWNDTAIGIDWPLGTPTCIHPRDASYPDLLQSFKP